MPRASTYHKNPQFYIEKAKEYIINNPHKKKEYYEKFKLNKKAYMIKNWKNFERKNIALDLQQYTWDEIYNIWLNQKECMGCGLDFNANRRKCLDHDHKDGKFRGVICYSCNRIDIFKNLEL